jgi:hypothetical protein
MATQPHVPLYSTHDGELVVTDPDSGQVLWQGLIQAMPISKIAPVPGAADAVVLLDYDKQPPAAFPSMAGTSSGSARKAASSGKHERQRSTGTTSGGTSSSRAANSLPGRFHRSRW